MVSKEPQAPGKLPMCEAPISADTSSSTIFRLRHLSVQGSNLLLPAHYLRPLRVWKIRNRGRAFGHSSGLPEAGRGGGGSGDSRLRRPRDRRYLLALAVRDKETLQHRDPAVLGPLLSLGVGVPAWF